MLWIEIVRFPFFLLTDFVVSACGANFKLYNKQNVLLCQNPNDDANGDDVIIISPDSFDIKKSATT